MVKRLLKSLVLVLGLIGFGIALYPFIAALFPGSGTEDPGFLIVSLDELEYGKAKVFEHNRRPIIVIKYQGEKSDSVSAFIGLPNFSDPMIQGCGVRPVQEYKNFVNIGSRAAFFEPCRGVLYDRYGEVLAGSHPKAIQLYPVRVKVSGTKLYVGKFT